MKLRIIFLSIGLLATEVYAESTDIIVGDTLTEDHTLSTVEGEGKVVRLEPKDKSEIPEETRARLRNLDAMDYNEPNSYQADHLFAEVGIEP